MSVLEHVLELADSANDLALLFAGGVVPAILFEVTPLPGQPQSSSRYLRSAGLRGLQARRVGEQQLLR